MKTPRMIAIVALLLLTGAGCGPQPLAVARTPVQAPPLPAPVAPADHANLPPPQAITPPN